MDKTYKNAVKTVLGTALSVGITVEGQDPRVIQQQIDDGEHDGEHDGKLNERRMD